ncbi:hypothetical protein FB451DRAFT_1398002 [Mycena latifolia]|nr:hypothetical protein FB451DRAFT_1398002 [Mycena latifolia]
MFSQVLISSQVTPSQSTQVVRSRVQVNHAPEPIHSHALDSPTPASSDTDLASLSTPPSLHNTPKRQRKLSFTRLLRFTSRNPEPKSKFLSSE